MACKKQEKKAGHPKIAYLKALQKHLEHGINASIQQCENASTQERLSRLETMKGYIDKAQTEAQAYLGCATHHQYLAIAFSTHHDTIKAQSRELTKLSHLLTGIKEDFRKGEDWFKAHVTLENAAIVVDSVVAIGLLIAAIVAIAA